MRSPNSLTPAAASEPHGNRAGPDRWMLRLPHGCVPGDGKSDLRLRAKAGENLRGCLLTLLKKREQVVVDLVRIGCRHPVGKTWIHLQRGVLHQLRGHESARSDGHNLIVIAVKDQCRDVELFQ